MILSVYESEIEVSTMAEQQETDATASDERPRPRSPQFPFMALKKAISRAHSIEGEYKKSAGRIANVMALWGFSPKSSSGLQTIAALKSFGLIEYEGKGKARKVRLSASSPITMTAWR